MIFFVDRASGIGLGNVDVTLAVGSGFHLMGEDDMGVKKSIGPVSADGCAHVEWDECMEWVQGKGAGSGSFSLGTAVADSLDGLTVEASHVL